MWPQAGVGPLSLHVSSFPLYKEKIFLPETQVNKIFGKKNNLNLTEEDV